ncbi:transposase [Gemmatimonas sp.]|uniref:transposase n=1 Tax=Gemmatimonas sp. TaxID=1962908 RepID=UPI003564BF7A
MACLQTQGSLANRHPHLHLLVTDGGFRPDGTFVSGRCTTRPDERGRGSAARHRPRATTFRRSVRRTETHSPLLAGRRTTTYTRPTPIEFPIPTRQAIPQARSGQGPSGHYHRPGGRRPAARCGGDAQAFR